MRRRWIGQYILDENGEPVPEPDTIRWAMWFETANRIVRQDRVDGVLVSTVFLSLDHAYSFTAHEPVLWETMIFGGEHDQYMRRYTSKSEALQGHIEALMMIESWNKDIEELQRMLAVQPCWEKRKLQ